MGARGFDLPRVRSSDLYEDITYTQLVDNLSHAQTGDIIGLCRKDKKDFWGVHMGILYINEQQEKYILHNARHIGNIEQETLTNAMAYPAHAKIAWIKRPIIRNPKKLNPDGLKRLGFGHLI